MNKRDWVAKPNIRLNKWEIYADSDNAVAYHIGTITNEANAHLTAAAPNMHQSGTELDKAIGEAIIKIAQATKLSNALIQIIQETVLPAQENWRKAKAKAEGK